MDHDEMRQLREEYPEAAKDAYDLYRTSRELYERTQAAMGRRPEVHVTASSTEGVRIGDA